jgi:hypothetical protein
MIKQLIGTGILAGAGIVPLAIATPANAAAVRCYQQPLQRLWTHATPRVDIEGDVYYTTEDVMVTEGSPCRDINLRGSQVAGAPRCVEYRVRFNGFSDVATAWRTVCRGWRVALPGAVEGLVYHVESHNVPASVVVRG